MSRILKRTVTYTASDTWICPSDVNSIDVFMVGGGGAGGFGTTGSMSGSPGGGGGGGYTRTCPNIVVTPGSSHSVLVGDGANQYDGGDGGISSFDGMFIGGGGSGFVTNGFRRSRNSGGTFENISMQGITVNTICSLQGYVIGTPAGIYISPDGGDSWESANNGLGNYNIRCIVSYGHALIASTANGVYFSQDNGNSWSLKLANVIAFQLVVNGSYVYVATNRGIFSSTTGGLTWTSTSYTFYVEKIVAFANTVFACMGNQIYRSADNGSTWSVWALTNQSGLCANTIWPLDSGNVIVGTGNGLYEVEFQDPNYWYPYGLNTDNFIISAFNWNGGHLIVGRQNGGLWCFDGYTWEQLSTGVNPTETPLCIYADNDSICVGMASSKSGGNGGSGGAGGFGSGGVNGTDGESGVILGGIGQHTTTRAFGESEGTLYSGGGQGGGRPYAGMQQYDTPGGGGEGEIGGEDTMAGFEYEAPATSGISNTGGGGGGANADCDPDNNIGVPGNGGSGIVIIREYYVSVANSSAGFSLLLRR
jgi:hypothetical protein